MRLSSNRKIFYRCACLVRTGIEILTSAGQLIDWKATIHFDTTPWEAVNLRATRASANRVDAGVSLLNKKQRDIFTEPEPCSPCQKLEREGRRGKYVTKRKGVETVKLFGSDDVTRMPRKSISVRMQNFLSSRFPFVIVGFLEFERRISIR